MLLYAFDYDFFLSGAQQAPSERLMKNENKEIIEIGERQSSTFTTTGVLLVKIVFKPVSILVMVVRMVVVVLMVGGTLAVAVVSMMATSTASETSALMVMSTPRPSLSGVSKISELLISLLNEVVPFQFELFAGSWI